MAKRLAAVLVVVLLLVCAGDDRVFSGPPPSSAQDIELATGWKLASASGLDADGQQVSQAGYDDSRWHPIKRMPATVLEILQEDGVYPNLYYGKNMLTEVPQDLYKQDWWYRTPSMRRPTSRPMCSTSRVSTTAPISGSTAARWPPTATSSACTTATNSTSPLR